MGGLDIARGGELGRRSAAYARGYVEPRRTENSERLDIVRFGERNGRRMNTSSSGSARVDDSKGHPQGEVRGRTNPVKSLKRLLRSLALDGRKCAPDAGLSPARRAASFSKT